MAFEGERYVSLATYRKSGVEVRTPVWFAEVDDKLYMFSAGDAGKVKRLRHSSRARVAPSDARGYTRGAWREARARIVTDPVDIGYAHDALRAKYRWQMYMADVLARLLGRYERRAWIEVELQRTSTL
jgi:PPOX class probable F420-dependent enzyme